MKYKSKILCILLIAVALTVFTLSASACSADFNIKWQNYLPDAAEYYSQANNLGTVTPMIFEIGAEISVGQYGLITVQSADEMYGYLPAYEVAIGKGIGLTRLSERHLANGINVFVGSKADSGMVLYDAAGKIIFETETFFDIESTPAIRYLNGVPGRYAVVRYVSGLQVYNAYYPINADGTLSLTAYNDTQLSDGDNAISMPGETFNMPYVTLENWLNKDMQSDEFVDGTRVRTFNNTVIFYNTDNKEISRWTIPQNMFKSPVYVDKCLVYGTLTPVDGPDNPHCNYIDARGNRYKYILNSFNIKTGKTSTINGDYVIYGNEYDAMYNNRDGKYDLASVSALRMLDGIAYENQYADTCIINNSGKIGFSQTDSVFGMPVYKLSNGDFITNSGNVINSKNQLKMSFGSLSAIYGVTEDAIVAVSNGKIGSVLSDGKVKIPFAYNTSSKIYGKYTFVRDALNSRYVMDVTNGSVQSVAALTDADESNITITTDIIPLISVRSSAANTYSLYLISGEKIADNAVDNKLTVIEYYVGNKLFAIGQVATDAGLISVTDYFKIAL